MRVLAVHVTPDRAEQNIPDQVVLLIMELVVRVTLDLAVLATQIFMELVMNARIFAGRVANQCSTILSSSDAHSQSLRMVVQRRISASILLYVSILFLLSAESSIITSLIRGR